MKRACQLPLGDSDQANIQPGSFADLELRKLAEQLDLLTHVENDVEPPTKRRKIATEPEGLPEMYERIYKLIGKNQETNNLVFDSAFMYVKVTPTLVPD